MKSPNQKDFQASQYPGWSRDSDGQWRREEGNEERKGAKTFSGGTFAWDEEEVKKNLGRMAQVLPFGVFKALIRRDDRRYVYCEYYERQLCKFSDCHCMHEKKPEVWEFDGKVCLKDNLNRFIEHLKGQNVTSGLIKHYEDAVIGRCHFPTDKLKN